MTISLWVIYERPRDFPDKFVVRRWAIGNGCYLATGDFSLANDLDGARRLVPPGLACLGRDASDEPHIVESWI